MKMLLLSAALLFAGTASAQTPPAPAPAAAPAIPEGMVDDPCVGAPVRSKAINDYLRQMMYHLPAGAAPLPLPAAEYAKLKAESAEYAKRNWGDSCKYAADNARLTKAPAAERRVVFMGDSITEGWGLAHPDFFSGGLVDRGISGQTTPQMLTRFWADVVALHPQVVQIMAGTNDLAGNTGANRPEDYKNNIRAMVTLAKANHITVLLASIPPVLEFSWKKEVKPTRLPELNDWLRAYAKEQGAIYVDYHSVLQAADGSFRKELTFDGVHPNADGYAVMEPIAKAAIAEALKKKR